MTNKEYFDSKVINGQLYLEIEPSIPLFKKALAHLYTDELIFNKFSIGKYKKTYGWCVYIENAPFPSVGDGFANKQELIDQITSSITTIEGLKEYLEYFL